MKLKLNNIKHRKRCNKISSVSKIENQDDAEKREIFQNEIQFAVKNERGKLCHELIKFIELNIAMESISNGINLLDPLLHAN